MLPLLPTRRLMIRIIFVSAKWNDEAGFLCRVVGSYQNPGVPVLFGWHNLSPLVEIGLTDLPKSGGANPQGRQACRYHYLSPMYCRPGGTFSNQVGPRGQAYAMDIICPLDWNMGSNVFWDKFPTVPTYVPLGLTGTRSHCTKPLGRRYLTALR